MSKNYPYRDQDATGGGSPFPSKKGPTQVEISNLKELLKGLKEVLKVQKEISTVENERSVTLDNLTNFIQQEAVLNKDKLRRVRTEEDLTKRIAENDVLRKKAAEEISKLTGKAKTDAQSILDSGKQIDSQLRAELANRKKIEKSLGLVDNLVEGLKSIPGIGVAISKVSEDILADQERAILNNENRFKAFGRSIRPALNEALPAAATAAFLASIIEASKRTAEFSRNLGISEQQAGKLQRELALVTTNTAVNLRVLSESFTNLNQQFGTASTMLRKDIVAEVARLGRLTELSAESQGKFASTMMRTGLAASEVTRQARAAVVAAEAEKGVRLDINKTLDEAGKVTGQIAANLGFNVVAIAGAIAKAKQFGMELSSVASIGDKLLNFQESISAELQAELFTGKQLNLERARLFALTGDYKGLTDEINKNIVSDTEFSRMNVLEQRKLAEALGMSADELANIVFNQDNLARLAQEARDRGEEQLALDLERRDVAMRFNDLVENLKERFVAVATSLAPLASVLMSILDNAFMLYTIFGLLGAIKLTGLLMSLAPLIPALGAAFATASGLTMALTFGGAALAIGAGMAILASALSDTKEEAISVPRFQNLGDTEMVTLQSGMGVFDAGETVMRTENFPGNEILTELKSINEKTEKGTRKRFRGFR